MRKVLVFVLAVFIAIGMSVAGCKKQDEMKPVPKTSQKKKSSTSKKSSTTKKTTKSSKKNEREVPSL